MAFDAFLKLGDIVGESPDAKHKGEIEIASYSFGVANTGSASAGGGGAGAGKAAFTDFAFTAPVSAASPQLMLACASGKHFPDALLTLRRAGGSKEVEFCKVTFKGVLVSSYQSGGAGSEDVPSESVTLNFAAMKVEFTTQGASGAKPQTSSGGWDQSQNKPYKE